MLIIETNLKFEKPLIKRIATNKIILHHSASKVANAQLIDSWHRARGWNGMGYHFLVRKENGIVETGRPIDTVGAHCTGQNADSIGICFEGDFDKEEMNEEQLKTGKELIAYLRSKYGDNIRIAKHKDFMATDCPGKNFPFDELVKKKKVKKAKYSGAFPKLYSKGYIEKGDKGTQVRLLQLFLNWYGNYGLVVDGDFGQKTLTAVKNFQASEKLQIDGLFGAKSLAKAKKVKR